MKLKIEIRVWTLEAWCWSFKLKSKAKDEIEEWFAIWVSKMIFNGEVYVDLENCSMKFEVQKWI